MNAQGAGSRHGRIVGWYVNDGTERHEYKTEAGARRFWDACPAATVLGQWVEVVREGGYGHLVSRHGNVVEDRR